MPAISGSSRFNIRAFARQHQGARSVAVSLGLHAALGAALVLWFTIPQLQEPEERAIEVAFDPLPARAPEQKQELPKLEPEREVPKDTKPRERVRTPPVPYDGPPAPPADPPAGPAGPSGTGTAPMLAPAPTYRVNPVFPARAQEREREGVAEVAFVVGANGEVTQLQLLNESPEGFGFGASAMSAVSKWRFATAQPGLYRVTVRFRLN